MNDLFEPKLDPLLINDAPLYAERTFALLHAMRGELATLRADVRRIATTPNHFARLAALLPAIAALGDRSFNAAEVLDYALSTSSGATGLRIAVKCAIGDIDQGAARRLGRLLQRGQDVDILGLMIKQVGEDADGMVWWISRSRLPCPSNGSAGDRVA